MHFCGGWLINVKDEVQIDVQKLEEISYGYGALARTPWNIIPIGIYGSKRTRGLKHTLQQLRTQNGIFQGHNRSLIMKRLFGVLGVEAAKVDI
ncbi:hypothetical protein ACS0TY_031456 [Phlomoides rotata]